MDRLFQAPSDNHQVAAVQMQSCTHCHFRARDCNYRNAPVLGTHKQKNMENQITYVIWKGYKVIRGKWFLLYIRKCTNLHYSVVSEEVILIRDFSPLPLLNFPTFFNIILRIYIGQYLYVLYSICCRVTSLLLLCTVHMLQQQRRGRFSKLHKENLLNSILSISKRLSKKYSRFWLR